MTRNIFQETILPLLTDDPIEVIRYLQLKKLIKEELKCETCCENMNWTRYSRSKDGSLEVLFEQIAVQYPIFK